MKDRKKRSRIIWMLLLACVCVGYYYFCGYFAGFYVSLLKIWLWSGIAIGCFVPISLIFNKLLSRFRIWQAVVRFCKILEVCGMIILALLSGWIIHGTFQQGEEGFDYIIILGAAVIGTKPSYVLNTRIMAGYDYLLANPDTKVIATGGTGTGKKISEAECIAQTLAEMGIEPDRILVEDQSSKTVENLKNAYQMIQESDPKVGIITSDFHVSRALLVARSEGFHDVSGIAVPYSWVLFPHYMVREMAVLTGDLFLGNINVGNILR